MGLALPLALGLAIFQPNRPVIVVEGDGALLMHIGVLVTVGAVNAANLTVLLVQNGVHAASGGQVLTNSGLDLAQLARAAGIVNAENIATPHALAAAMRSSSAGGGSKVLVLSTETDLEVFGVGQPVKSVFDEAEPDHAALVDDGPHQLVALGPSDHCS